MDASFCGGVCRKINARFQRNIRAQNWKGRKLNIWLNKLYKMKV
jgi:hypothetical protein